MTDPVIRPPIILRYVYAILAVVVTSVVAVLGALYVAQRSEIDAHSRIQSLYLKSVEESIELARETGLLEQRLLDQQVQGGSKRLGAAGVQSIQIGYAGILQSMRYRVANLSTLGERNADEIFVSTLQRLNIRFAELDEILRRAQPNSETITAVRVLGTTVEQYKRLHQIAADRELLELNEIQRQRPRFLGVLALCLSLGVLAAWYLVRSLKASLQRRAAAELALAESQERLHHLQKLDALGQFVGGTAHDFNNWLTVILGHADMLAEEAKENDRIMNGLDEIRQAGLQASSLTKQLLAFSRRQQYQARVLNLNELLQGMEDVLRRLLSEDIELSFTYAEDLGEAELDPDQVQQLVFNLVNNARDAMPEGGLLAIATERIDPGRSGGAIDGLPEGEYVRLSVSDSGTGMDDVTRRRAFEPFFTTKKKGHGTGLGLSMAHGIVTSSGGHIFLESAAGKGTRFDMYFPSVKERPDEAPDEARQSASTRGNETILVVEDNALVRRVIEKGLGALGYRVLGASDGAAGIEICRSEPSRIDMILSDVVMPEMSGPRFMAAALKLRPDAVAIYMSGYTEDEILRFRRGDAEPDIPLIWKPFDLPALSRMIRDELDKKAGMSFAKPGLP